MTNTKISHEEHAALVRVCELAEGQAQALRAIGSKAAQREIGGWAAEIREVLREGEGAQVQPSTAEAVDHLRFLMQGLQVGLSNADLDERADKVRGDVHRLGRLTRRLNQSFEGLSNEE